MFYIGFYSFEQNTGGRFEQVCRSIFDVDIGFGSLLGIYILLQVDRLCFEDFDKMEVGNMNYGLN